MNSEQASLIARALDFWCRIHGGQLEELRHVNIHADADDIIDELKKQIFPSLGRNASTLNYKYGKEAFNLRKLIEYNVSWNERPLKKGEFQTVNYDGPMEGWWETEPAEMTVLKNGEYKRVKTPNPFFLAKELEDVIGTSDLEEAVQQIRFWKQNSVPDQGA
jgi:hypothetical protein